jgi:hypothetical protein
MKTPARLIALGAVLFATQIVQGADPVPVRPARPVPGVRAGSNAAKAPAGVPYGSGQAGGGEVGHLATRDYWITMTLGPQGPRYTVRTKAGRILHRDLSAGEVEARLPKIHELISTGYAARPATGATLDARLGSPAAGGFKPRSPGPAPATRR